MRRVLARYYDDMVNKHCEMYVFRSCFFRPLIVQQDIRNLLADWEEEIDGCELVFIRATGANRRIFMDYDGAPIVKGDERLRTFPFPTRRPVRLLFDFAQCRVQYYLRRNLNSLVVSKN